MTLHKISAGDGYTYLTKQVATGDNSDLSRDSLASYYGSRGESPGQWTGRLAAAVGVEGVVSEAQMLALFGEGRHPDAEQLGQALVAAGRTAAAAMAETRLGRPFPVFDIDSQFPACLAAAYAQHNLGSGVRSRAPIDDDIRAGIRTRVAREMFTVELRRSPADARELSGWIARNTRPTQVAVAGYDLTFSPSKSVSVLWALAPREVSQKVAAAHDAAVATVLERLETEAAYTRQGAHGVRQVKVDGVIAAAFTHRSSRAGDPDLHTHVTVAAKVRGPDGSWLSLDGRMLYKGNVTYSEMYNSELEAEVTSRLPGVRFVDVARIDAGKRPVRELAGLDPTLLSVLSKRAGAIEPRRAELAAQFTREHGRTPTRGEQLALAQQATLDTREDKKESRTHAEERAAWRAEATATLGHDGLTNAVAATLTATSTHVSVLAVASRHEVVVEAAGVVLATVSEHRAVWQDWHIRAEAQRQIRRLVDEIDPAERDGLTLQTLVDEVVEQVLTDADVVPLVGPEASPTTLTVAPPVVLRNPDGRSQYEVFRAATYTTGTTLAAEARIVATAGRRDGRRADTASVDTAVLESHANGKTLNTGQAALVRELATSGARFQLALAPAGSGKTTAMKALTRAWESAGGTVVGLAPSAAAASELAASIGQRADTVDKLVHELDRSTANPRHPTPGWMRLIDSRTLIIVDEVSLASTRHLDRLLAFAAARGASVRGVGDPAQRSSVAAGGVMRDVETAHGAVSLAEVMRFTDPTEGAASLALRAGDPASLGHYLDHGRIHVGDLDTALAAVYDGWSRDRDLGRDAVMLAPLRDQVAVLNIRARADRVAALIEAGGVIGLEASLAHGQLASVGDVVQTRRNDRSLSLGMTDFVRNGYRYSVEQVYPDGSLLARHTDSGRRVQLPAAYLGQHTELGYARTIAAAQGMTAGGETVDPQTGASVRVQGAAHVLVDPAVMDRESFYVAMTRGTAANHAYVVAAGRGDEHAGLRPETVAPATAAELLAGVLERSSIQVSATSEVAAAVDPSRQLGAAAAQFSDAIRVGAGDLLGADAVARLADDAERLVPGVTSAPAWPTLHGHLAVLELTGRHHGEVDTATRALAAAATGRELTGANNVAALLDWRLVPVVDRHPAGAGPLTWLPPVPAPLVENPTWGAYLQHMSARVETLASGVSDRAARWGETAHRSDAPVWARQLVAAGAHERSLSRLAVWRSAHDVPDADLRPTGPPVLAAAERNVQRELERIAAGYGVNYAADADAMTPLAERIEPNLVDDPYWPQLASRLRAADRAGVDVAGLAVTAVTEGGALPDEQPAAALWWRLTRHLAPNVADGHVGGVTARPDWSAHLDDLVGDVAAEAVLTAPAWPALVARIDAAARDHHDPAELFADGLRIATTAGVPLGELATATLWHVSLIADPPPPPMDHVLPPDPADLEREAPHDWNPIDNEIDRAGVAVAGEWTGEDVGAHFAPVDADPFVGAEAGWSAHVDPSSESNWFLTDLATAVVNDPYRHLPPIERVAALGSDLTAARAALALLTTAVMSDRGRHVTAVASQIRSLRQRADALAPFVAERAFASSDWQSANAAFVQAQTALAEASIRALLSPTTDYNLEVPMLERNVELNRGHKTLAYNVLATADARLADAAGGQPVVTQHDATLAWAAASDLDLGELNTSREAARTLQDQLWRADAAATRTPEAAIQCDVITANLAPGLDYGALEVVANEADVFGIEAEMPAVMGLLH